MKQSFQFLQRSGRERRQQERVARNRESLSLGIPPKVRTRLKDSPEGGVVGVGGNARPTKM